MKLHRFDLLLILAAVLILNLAGSTDAASIVAVPGTTGTSQGLGVSNDGTVVGYTTVNNQRRAFVWNAGLAGVTILDDIAGGIERGEARDISADGTTVVGHGSWGTDVNRSHVATSWTRPGDAWTTTSPAAQRLNPTDAFSRAYGVSSDGAIIVGVGGPSGGDYAAFRWTAGGGMVSITSSNSIAQGISPDGSIIAGRVNTTPSLAWYDTSWHNQGTYYIYNQPAEWGGNVTSTPSAEAMAAANPQAGVNILVGQATGNSISVPAYGGARVDSTQAMMWTSSGWIELGFLQPTPYLSSGRYYALSMAMDVSADGTTVVGLGYQGGYGQLRAFIWDSTNGMRALSSVLSSAPYNLDLTGYTLTRAMSISANGRYIIGDGGPTGIWIADLDVAGSPPVVSTWSSIRLHGISELSEPIITDGTTVATESRRGGLTTMDINFDMPVDAVGGIGPSSVTVTNSLGAVFVPDSVTFVNSQQVRVQFASPLPNAELYTFSVAGNFTSQASGLAIEAQSDCQVRVLVGDCNGDGSINLVDLAAVRNFNRQTVTESNARYDVNEDGEINLIDVALVRSQTGTTAP